MFRFTIRDVLWLTVVVAVALTFWLGWSRGIAKVREESAAREAKLQQDVVAERDKVKNTVKELQSAYVNAKVQLKVQEAQLKLQAARIQEASPKEP